MGLGASCGRNEGIQAPGGDIGGVRGWWCVGCLAIAHIRSLSLTKDVNPFAIARERRYPARYRSRKMLTRSLSLTKDVNPLAIVHGSDWHLDWIISPS